MNDGHGTKVDQLWRDCGLLSGDNHSGSKMSLLTDYGQQAFCKTGG